MRLTIKAGIAAVLIILGTSFQSTAQTRNPSQRSKTRGQLIEENTRMQDMLDSLALIIRDLNIKLDKAQSAAEEEAAQAARRRSAAIDITPDATEERLGFWYEQHLLQKNKEGENYNMETVHFTSDVPDKVIIERLENMHSFITIPYNETVKNYIILYSEKMPTKMPKILGLSRHYLPIFEDVFNQYGLPEELKYMAIIESALNPTAVSRAGAKGMWQFMHTTAKSYGLTINSYIDERFDTYKAADAAARYLRDAYRIFGDWNLAISSYNCGAGNVQKAIRRAGGKTDFWSIFNYLPKETRGYVPAFVGAMYAMTYYKEYGIKPDNVDLPAHVDTFQIKKMLHFQQVNDLVGVPMETLQDLNPQYIHDIIPGGGETYILRLPYNYSSSYVAVEDTIYSYKASEYLAPATLQAAKNGSKTTVTANGTIEVRTAYKVKSGDTLGKIASRNKTTVSNLKKWNNLKSDNLRIGQTIYIVTYAPAPKTEPKKDDKPAPAPAPSPAPAAQVPVQVDSAAAPADTLKAAADSVAAPAKAETEVVSEQPQTPVQQSVPTEPEYTTYTVKYGDTLFKIASKYPGVSVDDIMNYNGIGSNIRIGMKLKIPKK